MESPPLFLNGPLEWKILVGVGWHRLDYSPSMDCVSRGASLIEKMFSQ